MSITVGDLEITNFTDHPFGHSGEATLGQTVRRWPIKTILTPTDWLTLNVIYETWRNTRLNDPDTMASLDVGTTVPLTGTLYSLTWTNVATWFSQAPEASASGGQISCSFELIDAEQQLAVMIRQRELGIEAPQEDEEFLFGTYTLGNLTLNLTAQPDGYEGNPTVELSAGGIHVIKGPLAATRVKRIKGWTTQTGAANTIRQWYEGQVASKPSAGTYWPSSPPDISYSAVIVSGVKTTRCDVSVDLVEIR